MKAIKLLSVGLAAGMLACTSEDTPTEPPSGCRARRLLRAAKIEQGSFPPAA
jgi:hypothetical protein